MHDKRSATVSARVSPELELASRTLASADGRTLSDLIEHLLSDYVAAKRRAYLELRSVFGDGEDLPGKHGG